MTKKKRNQKVAPQGAVTENQQAIESELEPEHTEPEAMESGAEGDGVMEQGVKAEEFVVYMAGKTTNLTHKRPEEIEQQIEQQFAAVSKIAKAGKCLQIHCISQAQRDLMLSAKKLSDVDISCSEPRAPRSRAATTNKPPRSKRYVITGVPLEYTCNELAAAIDAKEVRRIKRRVSGVLTDTLACVLHYDPEAQVPERIRLKWLSFKTRDYVPQPTRCHQCQGFGHIKAHCKKGGPTCPRCAGPHDFQACPNLEAPKCANCGGSHSAAYPTLPQVRGGQNDHRDIHQGEDLVQGSADAHASVSSQAESTAERDRADQQEGAARH